MNNKNFGSMLHDRVYNSFFRQLLFLGILIVAALIILGQLDFFVGSFLGAVTLYVVFRAALMHMTDKWRWPHWVAALTLTLLCLVVIGGLGYLIVDVIVASLPSFDTSQVVEWANSTMQKLNAWTGMEIISEDTVSRSSGFVAKMVGGIVNTTYSFAANIFMMLVIVYFMFAGGRKMECYLYRYIPFKGRSLSLLRTEFKGMVFSNAVGIPVIMVIQAIVASLGYWIIGVDNYVFWGFLTAICGLVPVVGTGVVYVPLAIYYLAMGHMGMGIIIALYGLLIISNADNLIRIVLLKKVNDTHPLVVIFGVFLGIPLFGFWGIIFGPLMISLLMLLIKIYFVEYGLLTAPEEAEILARTPAVAENPIPAKSVNDLHAVKTLRVLKTARLERPSKRGLTQGEEDAIKNRDKK